MKNKLKLLSMFLVFQTMYSHGQIVTDQKINTNVNMAPLSQQAQNTPVRFAFDFDYNLGNRIRMKMGPQKYNTNKEAVVLQPNTVFIRIPGLYHFDVMLGISHNLDVRNNSPHFTFILNDDNNQYTLSWNKPIMTRNHSEPFQLYEDSYLYSIEIYIDNPSLISFDLNVVTHVSGSQLFSRGWFSGHRIGN